MRSFIVVALMSISVSSCELEPSDRSPYIDQLNFYDRNKAHFDEAAEVFKMNGETYSPSWDSGFSICKRARLRQDFSDGRSTWSSGAIHAFFVSGDDEKITFTIDSTYMQRPLESEMVINTSVSNQYGQRTEIDATQGATTSDWFHFWERCSPPTTQDD